MFSAVWEKTHRRGLSDEDNEDNIYLWPKWKSKETYNTEVPVGKLAFLSIGLNNNFLGIETALVIWNLIQWRLFYNDKWHDSNDIKNCLYNILNTLKVALVVNLKLVFTD